MNLKKLDVRGVAHEFLIVGVLVIFSIVGVGYVVAGNANPSGAKAAAGDAIQGGDVTGPAKGTELSCSIDPLPETAAYKQVLKPYVRVKNVGSANYDGFISTNLSLFDASTHAQDGGKGTANKTLKIKKGKTVKIALPKYRVPYAKTGGITKLHYSAQVEGLGWCNNTWVKLPQKPATTKKAPVQKKTTPQPVNTGGGGSIGGGEG